MKEMPNYNYNMIYVLKNIFNNFNNTNKTKRLFMKQICKSLDFNNTWLRNEQYSHKNL